MSTRRLLIYLLLIIALLPIAHAMQVEIVKGNKIGKDVMQDFSYSSIKVSPERAYGYLQNDFKQEVNITNTYGADLYYFIDSNFNNSLKNITLYEQNYELVQANGSLFMNVTGLTELSLDVKNWGSVKHYHSYYGVVIKAGETKSFLVKYQTFENEGKWNARIWADVKNDWTCVLDDKKTCLFDYTIDPTYELNPSAALTSSGAITSCIGWNITMNMNATLKNITTKSGVTCNTMRVYNATSGVSLITSSAISSNVASFDLNLTEGNRYVLACDSGGASYTRYWSTESYPVAQTVANITTWAYSLAGAGGSGCTAYSVVSEAQNLIKAEFYVEDEPSPTNYTVTVQNVSYSSPVIENTWNNFTMNISWGQNVTNVSAANLTYNNTIYPASILSSGGSGNNTWAQYGVEILAPTIAFNTNITFNWTYYVELDNGTNYANTTSNYAQTVLYIPNMSITATNSWNSSAINNFNVTITNSTYEVNLSTTNGTIITPLKTWNGLFNITIQSENYFNSTYIDWNASSNISASMYQSEVRFQARNNVTNASISSFTVQTSYQNFTSSGGVSTMKVDAGTHQLIVNVSGYAVNTFDYAFVAQSNTTDIIYLNPTYNIVVLKESDGTKFNVNETNSTNLIIYCTTNVTSYAFNTTTNDNTLEASLDCPWVFMKLDVAYSANTYFRTLIPDHNVSSVTFYAIDLNTEQAVQIILRLKDLTGEFLNGTVRLERYVSTSEVDIIEQQFDIENKAVLYLIQNQLYTITIISTDGEERTTGYFLADSAGERTITVPEIPFVPTSTIGNYVTWSWSTNASPIRLQYNDTQTLTDNLTFWVLNGSNTSQVLYNTTSLNVSTATFTYSTSENQTYVACWEANHQELGFLPGECKTYGSDGELGFWDGWESDDKSTFTNWVCFIVLLLILFGVGSANVGLALTVDAVLMFFFINIGWFNLGSPIINYIVLSLAGVMAVFTLFAEGMKR